MHSVLSWSSGGWTVWMRMRQVSHLRSGTRQRMLTPRRCLWQLLSTQANWEPLVWRSRKCFHRSLRPRRAVGLRAAQGYANLRVWVPNVSSCQWMMTLSLGHDVSEYVFVFLYKTKRVKMPLNHHTKREIRSLSFCVLNMCLDISVHICVHTTAGCAHALMYAQFVHSALGDEGGQFQLVYEGHLLLCVGWCLYLLYFWRGWDCMWVDGLKISAGEEKWKTET